MRIDSSIGRRLVAIAILLIVCFTLLWFIAACMEKSCAEEQTSGMNNTKIGVATVDDFFFDYLDIWSNIYTLNKKPTQDDPVHFNEKTFRKLTAKLYRDESKYGHLPEYWELTAFVQPNPTESDFTDYFNKSNPDSSRLEKALTLCDATSLSSDDQKRRIADVKVSALNALRELEIQQAEVKNKECESRNAKPEDYIDLDAIDVDYYKRMVKADPDNGYNHFFLACTLMSTGEWDESINEFEKTGDSSCFRPPMSFPSRYIVKNATDIEMGEGRFAKLSDRDKFTLTMFHLYDQTRLPNFIRAKDAYRDAKTGISLGVDARRTLNALHRAACKMGMNSDCGLIYNLVAYTLLQICTPTALEVGHSNDDKYFELSAVAALLYAHSIKEKVKTIADNSGDIRFKYLKRITGQADSHNEKKVEDLPEGVVGFSEDSQIISYECSSLEKKIAPKFKELAALDYNHPEIWYEKWYQMKSNGDVRMDLSEESNAPDNPGK